MADPGPSLLSYLPSTQPSPLRTSTSRSAARGHVLISVSADKPVYCNWIMLAVPVGIGGTALFTHRPAASTSTGKWTVTPAVQTGREIGLDNDDHYATITYDCVSPVDYLIAYDLALGLVGTVNDRPGPATILISENSGTTCDTSAFVTRKSTITLPKVLPDFYLRNFMANSPAMPTVPSTDFQAGAHIEFTWESNGSYFEVFAKGKSKPVHAGTEPRFILRGGVDRDSTFVLVASSSADVVPASEPDDSEPVYLYEALTVTVSDPVLRPSRVDVSDGLTVHGTTTLADVTVKGELTARQAPVAMLGPTGHPLARATHIEPTTVLAKTDGFAVARVRAPAQTGKRCFTIAAVGMADIWFETLGGTVGAFSTRGGDMYGNPSMICMPVPANSHWYYRGSNDVNNETTTFVEIYWFPMGGPSGKPTYEVLSGVDAEQAPAPPPVPLHSSPARRDAARSAAATAFLDRLEAALGTDLPVDSKAELANLLTRV